MWDINTGECLHVLMGHVAAVRCVQYDGRLVVSGAYDYMVNLFNVLFLKFFCWGKTPNSPLLEPRNSGLGQVRSDQYQDQGFPGLKS